MADEDLHYGKDPSLQFALNANRNQTDNIFVYRKFCTSCFRYKITDKWI